MSNVQTATAVPNLFSPKTVGILTSFKEATKTLAEYLDSINAAIENANASLSNTEARLVELRAQEQQIVAQNAEKARIANVDLELAIRQNQMTAFTKLAKDLGFAVLKVEEHKALVDEANTARSEVQNEVDRALLQAQTNWKAEVSRIQSQHDLQRATDKAQLQSLEAMVAFLNKELEGARAQADTVE